MQDTTEETIENTTRTFRCYDCRTEVTWARAASVASTMDMLSERVEFEGPVHCEADDESFLPSGAVVLCSNCLVDRMVSELV